MSRPTERDFVDLQIRLAETEAQAFVPGAWICPKCSFTLSMSIQTAKGIVPDLAAKQPQCIRDHGTMVRDTWKRQCEEANMVVATLGRIIPVMREAVKYFSQWSCVAFDANDPAELREMQRAGAMCQSMKRALGEYADK